MTHDITNIRKQLHDLIKGRLFGGGPWVPDAATNDAWHKQLLEWGLYKPHGDGMSFTNTELGQELQIDVLTCFLGHHEPYEIPSLLEEYGLISEEEADDLVYVRFEQNDEAPEEVLPPILRRIYVERFGAAARQSNLIDQLRAGANACQRPHEGGTAMSSGDKCSDELIVMFEEIELLVSQLDRGGAYEDEVEIFDLAEPFLDVYLKKYFPDFNIPPNAVFLLVYQAMWYSRGRRCEITGVA